MNQYHDPKSGRFTTAGAGGGGKSRGKTRGGETKRKVALRGGTAGKTGYRNTGIKYKTYRIKKERLEIARRKDTLKKVGDVKAMQTRYGKESGTRLSKRQTQTNTAYKTKAERRLAKEEVSTKGRRRLVRSNKSIMTREKDYDLKSRTKLRTY